MSGFPTDRFGRMIEPVTGSVIGFIDNNGNEQFTAPAVGTLAQMLAMSASPGLMFRTTDTCTVNGSISRAGNEWVYDGSQWRPRGPQRVLVDTVDHDGRAADRRTDHQDASRSSRACCTCNASCSRSRSRRRVRPTS
jgi:hypothetical protein